MLGYRYLLTYLFVPSVRLAVNYGVGGLEIEAVTAVGLKNAVDTVHNTSWLLKPLLIISAATRVTEAVVS